jgi:DNA-binding transcriptional regulator YhcF (GntR family)
MADGAKTPFAIVPSAVVAGLADLSPSAVRVAVALSSYAGRDGRCWPSRNALMQRAGIARNNTFAKAVSELTRAGLLTVKRRPGTTLYQWQAVSVNDTPSDGEAVSVCDTPSSEAVSVNDTQAVSVCDTQAVSVNDTWNMTRQHAQRTRRHDDDMRLALDVLESWNQTAERHGLAKAQKLGVNREKALRARLKDAYWKEHWRDALERIGQSQFLLGKKGDWRATLDWFTKPDSVLHILEGKYDDRGAKAAATVDGFGVDLAAKYAEVRYANE